MDPSTVLDYETIGQPSHWEPLAQDGAFFPLFIYQVGMVDLGIDTIPQAINDFPSIDFPEPMAEMDHHFHYLDPTFLNISNSSNQFPDLYDNLNEVYLGDVSLSNSPGLNFTL
jgi:hypothetical protein